MHAYGHSRDGDGGSDCDGGGAAAAPADDDGGDMLKMAADQGVPVVCRHRVKPDRQIVIGCAIDADAATMMTVS